MLTTSYKSILSHTDVLKYVGNITLVVNQCQFTCAS